MENKLFDEDSSRYKDNPADLNIEYTFSEEDIASFKNDVEDFIRDKEELEALDPLDTELMVEIDTDESGRVYFPSIRGADINPSKYYRDKSKTPRIDFTSKKSEKNKRSEAVIYLLADEKHLGDIIEKLPYGLIDKKVTGIGATHLEMFSDRNSIIVVPTRVLAERKALKDSNKFLYVGSHANGKVTSEKEIINYLNNTAIKYKKIIVVANSLKKVIESITANKEDVYREYFLMVDEIDTLQSDNHFRPELSKVIDYYYKFKLQRRALVSATVKEFSHPKLQKEPITIIKKEQYLKRNIELNHSNNPNKTLAKKIVEISNNSSDKILIAYNSIENILTTIHLLPEGLKDECGILCSENNDNVDASLKAFIDNEDKLSHRISFMTCVFFTGVDIAERYHLISVSNAKKNYSILPLNKIIQIHGRCRIENGISSDTIIYNTIDYPIKYNYKTYKNYLINKANKVIELLKAADKIKEGDADLDDLFNRIRTTIMERAYIKSMGGNAVLTRQNIDEEIEISYFNIDAIYEKLNAYYLLYSKETGLYEELKKEHNVIFFSKQEEEEEPIDEEKAAEKVRVDNDIQECILEIDSFSAVKDSELDRLIRQSTGKKSIFFKRFKEHFKYHKSSYLTQALKEIAPNNKKSYRGLNTALYFRALDEKHPFKLQIHSAFKVGIKYSSKEIHELISVIIKDQLFKDLSSLPSQSKCVSLFKCFVGTTYTGGEYLVKDYNPKQIPEPLKRIPKDMYAVEYFKI